MEKNSENREEKSKNHVNEKFENLREVVTQLNMNTKDNINSKFDLVSSALEGVKQNSDNNVKKIADELSKINLSHFSSSIVNECDSSIRKYSRDVEAKFVKVKKQVEENTDDEKSLIKDNNDLIDQVLLAITTLGKNDEWNFKSLDNKLDKIIEHLMSRN